MLIKSLYKLLTSVVLKFYARHKTSACKRNDATVGLGSVGYSETWILSKWHIVLSLPLSLCVRLVALLTSLIEGTAPTITKSGLLVRTFGEPGLTWSYCRKIVQLNMN